MNRRAIIHVRSSDTRRVVVQVNRAKIQAEASLSGYVLPRLVQMLSREQKKLTLFCLDLKHASLRRFVKFGISCCQSCVLLLPSDAFS